jgi:uncharacterized protein YdeI (YjbR/CyaY-like superfamily)
MVRQGRKPVGCCGPGVLVCAAMGAGRAMITEIEDYFAKGCGRCDRFATADCSTRHWAEGLAGLRDICRGAGLEETVKWGHPCYVHAGRNVSIIGAFRGDFRLTFFQAGLMKDPEGVLERQGPNTAHADMIRFTDAAQPAAMAGTIRAYLAEAMGYAERGIRAPKAGVEPDLPEEMIAALDADVALAEAFAALTPGRRKSYAIALSSAKKPETRVARIEKFRDRILAGKGAMER